MKETHTMPTGLQAWINQWVWITLLVAFTTGFSHAGDGVYARITQLEPSEGHYHLVWGGTLHFRDPVWYLRPKRWPESGTVQAGQPTPWFNIAEYAGENFHGRMNRAGGVAEFPYISANVISDTDATHRRVIIELATHPDADSIVKRFEDDYEGTQTGFLVSPHLKQDAESLETGAQMTRRRLQWAMEASGGHRIAPTNLIFQTSLWRGQRTDLNRKDSKVLWLLGFNVVANQWPGMHEEFPFGIPLHTHRVRFGPVAYSPQHADRAIHNLWNSRSQQPLANGMPINFSDEITAPVIGSNTNALAWFHRWLEERDVDAKDLGVDHLQDVIPIETPTELRERQVLNKAAANRIFYYTSRFRQSATTQSFRWLTEAVRRYFGDGPLTSTLLADHPYFSGTGLGMGMGPNPAWSSTPLAADWFELAREQALDLIGIEDWIGLQYMYGPRYTWEGFQLMGFQAAMIRSGGQGKVPSIAWITVSDKTNLVLKSTSSLCQGSKHVYHWSYGPTSGSTENYWSDLRPAYDGIVRMSRQVAAAEHILAPGQTRPTRLALLYSISSDLWQPYGYVHMLERRLTYLSLIHDQFLVDFITEEDIDAGRLKQYDVLYITDPCIKESAIKRITTWVHEGGKLYGTGGAGSRNAYNERIDGLASVFGIHSEIETTVQPGPYHIRGALNSIDYMDMIDIQTDAPESLATLGVIGQKTSFTPLENTDVIARFEDGSPAIVRNTFGKGTTLYIGACPAIAYGKEADFVPRALAEKWPDAHRTLINAKAQNVERLIQCSEPVVEAGIYDAEAGSVLILANFTYQHLPRVQIEMPLPKRCSSVRSLSTGALAFDIRDDSGHPHYPYTAVIEVPLGLNDMILFE